MDWKNLIKKHKKLWSALLSFVACVLCVTILAGAVLNSSIAVPDNPIASIDDSHLVKLSGKTEVMTENNEDSVNSDDQKEDDKKDDEDKGADDSKDSEQTTAAGNGKSNNKTAGEGKADNEYFTTSIEDKTIVYEDEYEFTVTQLREDVKLNSVMVVLNGGKKSAFTGKVTLKKGENTIQVICNYTGSDQKPFDVKSKVYTVTYEKREHYFEIKDKPGDNVYESKYKFTIKQLYPKTFKLKKITVTTNDEKGENWDATDKSSGTVIFKEGKNTVKVVCEYEGKNGKTFSDEQEFETKYDLTSGKAEIKGPSGTVTCQEYNYTFSASAYIPKDGKKTPTAVTAYVGDIKPDNKLDGSVDNNNTYTFNVNLKKHTTDIWLEAGENNTYSARKFTVICTKYKSDDSNDPSNEIVWDVKYNVNQSISENKPITTQDATLDFTVSASKGSNSLEIDNVKIDNGGWIENEYTAVMPEFKEYKVTCTLKGETETFTFKINRTDNNGSDVPVKGAPEITCSLNTMNSENGQINTNNETMSFSVSAKDWKGDWLTNFDITPSCDYSSKWENSYMVSYDLHLNVGNNTVNITVTDSLNRSSYLAYSINYTPSDVEKPIGKATIKIEATTIGLGMIFSGSVEYYAGDTVASKVQEILQENGYSPVTNNGTGANYYLKGISGINGSPLGTPNIPKDLEAKMLELNESDPTIYHPDPSPVYSLSEFDFSTGSGWMYEISYDGGKTYFYPNYSMGAAEFQDGCIIRLRFTLYYGCDIGGAASPANGGNRKGGLTNWEKEW